MPYAFRTVCNFTHNLEDYLKADIDWGRAAAYIVSPPSIPLLLRCILL